MELLEQCQKWNENSEFQKIINILEAVPAGKRTPELDSELARAYNNLAQPWDRGLFEKAIALSSAPSPASPSIREGLERFWHIFGAKPEQYTPNAPYTQFPYMVNGRPVDLVFQMNEGGMSKLSTDWLEQLRGWLQSGQWLERAPPNEGRPAWTRCWWAWTTTWACSTS